MRLSAAVALLIAITPAAAVAGDGFEYIVPGRPGVPVIMDGVDVSYAVVTGDFGLGKGVHNQLGIYGGRLIELVPPVGHYYPSSGQLPGYGRLEIEPPANRQLPQPAESYHQSWSAQSAPQPVQPEVPFFPPPVIMAPPDPMRPGPMQQNFDTRNFQNPTPNRLPR